VVPEQVAADPVALETWTHLAEVFAGMPQRFREGGRPLVAA
jgi:hypothetical protein